MRTRATGALVGVLAVVLLGGCSAPARASGGSERTVPLTVHWSRFSADRVTVAAGTTVRFVVVNGDPIDHELIIGDQAVQDRHEHGTEGHHGDRPGEVSAAAGTAASTTVTFTRRGTVPFGCHMSGHWAYGMRGTIIVR